MRAVAGPSSVGESTIRYEQPAMIASPGGTRRGFRIMALSLAAMLCMSGPGAFAQTAPPAPAQNVSQLPAQTNAGTAAQLDAARVVGFLDQVIAWYRQLGA